METQVHYNGYNDGTEFVFLFKNDVGFGVPTSLLQLVVAGYEKLSDAIRTNCSDEADDLQCFEDTYMVGLKGMQKDPFF